MQHAICLLPAVPVRSEPSHRSEMVSQLLFGEYVSAGEEKNDFVAVKCLFDGYEGWVQGSQLEAVNSLLPTAGFVGRDAVEIQIDGWKKTLSIGCPVFQPGELLVFGNTSVQFPPEKNWLWTVQGSGNITSGEFEAVCRHYLYTPYLWGGRSVYGIDCSGFAQQVFKLVGVKLLRDAYLQAEQGAAVNSLDEAAFGDLVFFQNEKGKVTHVGILLSGNQIIHASGRVRIDSVTEKGITHRETGKQTHHLHSIRRFF